MTRKLRKGNSQDYKGYKRAAEGDLTEEPPSSKGAAD